MKRFDTLKSITPASTLDIIDADGIEFYSSDGKTYYDLNEISTVLGQKNKHFTNKMTACLNGVTSMKSGNSAVIVEAYQGSGIVVPPKGWLKALETWTHDHGALFILDEIQSGMGRTGQMYTFLEEGLDPDMLLLGKALGNGIHVGAVLTKEAPEEYYRMALAGGAGDTELTYAAGCAVFEELLENDMLNHIRDVSTYMKSEFTKLKERNKEITHIECNGLAAYIEIESDICFNAVQTHMKERGLLAGFLANHKIIFRPPYAIQRRHIDLIIHSIETALCSIQYKKPELK